MSDNHLTFVLTRSGDRGQWGFEQIVPVMLEGAPRNPL
jgi:hypothetical protein